MTSRSTRLAVTSVAFLIGVLVMAQFAAQQRINSRRVTVSGVEGALLISNLVEANARLRQQVAELDAQLDAFRGATNQAQLQAMTDDLNRLRILNGAVKVSGPGVQVKVDGPATVLDLQDLLNELRNAGAEALSLNGQRIVASSVILPMPDGSVLVDGVTIRRPYVFAAIGDAAPLESALVRPGGLLMVFANSREGIGVSVEKSAGLSVPAREPASAFQYAVPVK
jgi:uncharacterized protein YlxW (UPF0749 family)